MVRLKTSLKYGQKVYPEYTNWYQKSCENLLPIFKKATATFISPNPVYSTDDLDYIYSILQGQAGLPPVLLALNLEQIKNERPELYQKLKKTGIVKGFDEQELHDSELLDRSEQCAIIRHHES